MQKEFRKISDTELYKLLKDEATKEQAFKELYSRHSARTFAYCKRILSDHEAAEDVFQEAFLAFLNAAAEEKEMTNVPAYILRIARNLCLNKKRENRRIYVSIDDYEPKFEDDIVERKETSELIAIAMDLLPEEHREAVVLQSYQGMSYNEIAETMNAPVSSVRNWVVRGKKKLKEALQPYFEVKRSES
jgi:RNA polymerase sigma-70 factor (ECF subfamily)